VSGDADGGSGSSLPLKAIGVATSLVLLAGYGLNFAYDFFPTLKPDPSTHLQAEIRSSIVEPRVELRSHLDRLGDAKYRTTVLDRFAREVLGDQKPPPSRSAIACERRRIEHYHGYVVYARVHVEGLKRRTVSLSANLYNADTKVRLTPGELPLAVPAPLAHELKSPTDEFVEAVFVDRPQPGQRVFARLELRGEGNTVLAVGDTSVFRGFNVGASQTPTPCR